MVPRTLIHRTAYALLTLAAVVLVSCDNVYCPLNTSVECVYGFYASARPTDGDFAPGAAVQVLDTITITALGPDTVVANRLYGESGVKLPVSYYGEVDSLLFAFTDAESNVSYDTVWVSKENQAHLDDPSCPLHMWHTVTAVCSTHNLIDSILINNTDINYDGLENLQIYFRTAQE